MEIERYQSNSHKSKEAKRIDEKKKIDKVIIGQAKTKKKNSLGKFISGFVADETQDIKSYLFKDVVIPTIKKTITDVVDMILYGGNGKRTRSTRMPSSTVSYRSFYDDPRDTRRDTRTVPGYSYDDVILETRGDAEEVLDKLTEIIDVYQMVSVGDLYDLVGITGEYTDQKYGWTNLATAEVVRTRDGYKLKLPKALPLK